MSIWSARALGPLDNAFLRIVLRAYGLGCPIPVGKNRRKAARPYRRRSSTPYIDRTNRSAISTSPGSSWPRAAPCSKFLTCSHVDLSRCSGGKRISSNTRTSASVVRVRTFEMMIGRGNGRDQFGRGKPAILRTVTGEQRTRGKVG